jgi:hypothetical protein
MKNFALFLVVLCGMATPAFAENSICSSYRAAKAQHQQRYLQTKYSNPDQAASSYKSIVRINGKMEQFGCN